MERRGVQLIRQMIKSMAVVCVGLTFCAEVAFGQIALDSTSSGTSNTTSLNFSHTLGGGTDRLLVISIAVEGATPVDADVTGSPTYNGVAMTKAIDEVTGTSFGINVELWYLLDAQLPAAGIYTVSITAATADNIVAGAVSVTGAEQQAPEVTGSNEDNQTGLQTIQTTVTTITDGAWLFDCIGSGNAITGFTPDAGQIERWDVVAASSRGAGSTEIATTAGLVTLGWTADTASNRISHVVAAFAPIVACIVDGDCDDANDCSDDTCGAGSICQHVINNSNPCDDGDLCTLSDACVAGTCMGTADPACNATGFQSPGSTAARQTAWNTPINAFASDNTFAISGGDSTVQQDWSNFGLLIPIGATVDGIELRIEHNHKKNNDTGIYTCQLIDGVGLLGVSKDGPDHGHQAEAIELLPSAGGPTDTWGAVLTEADVESSAFGITCHYTRTAGGGGNTLRVDHLQIIVYYTPECVIDIDCDDLNQCTTDTCNAGTCQNTPLTDGTACNDSDVCNVGETCQSGVCTGGAPADCSGAGGQCNTAACDPLGENEGNCDTLTPANEGLACDDGAACNIGETCQTGVCTGGAAPDCSAFDDQCNTASCDAAGAEGNCDTLTPTNEGLSCDDGAACNVGETCQTGACTGGAAPDCSAFDDQCNTASCDTLGAEGNCDTLTPINEGLSCDDGAACNVGETCQAGACTGGAAQDCSASGDQCNTASCDVAGAEGNCDTLTPTNEGLSCDDGAACNIGETCQAGACTGGTAPDCSAAGDQCNTASCDTLGAEGNCDTFTPTNEGLSCNDGAACNVGETCQAGACTGGAAPDCSGAGDQCNSASCDTVGTEGNCDTLTPINEGLSCDDGLFCTLTDTCSGGICSGTGDPCPGQNCDDVGDVCFDCTVNAECDDGNSCTQDICNAGTCENNSTNEGLACDDGDACLVGETCQTGVCTGGTAPDCSGAGDQCNTASCDAAGADGNCDTLTPVTDGTSCDDGASCNVGETCQAGVCTGGAAQDCSGAGDQCNTASCDVAGVEGNCDTFTPTNEGLSCNDSNSCNIGETCQTGVCTGGTAPDCSAAGDQCNTASCDTLGAEGNCDTLTPTNEGLSCDDGAACNVGETCQAGACTGGAGPDCSGAGDQCNTASCDVAGAEGNCDTLTPINEGLSCDDGAACNVGETCQAGVCTGGAAPDCSAAGDQCNSASCDVAGAEGNCDTLTPTNEGLSCDDAAACNVGEICQTGVCTGGAAQDCSASGDQCNTASCDTLGAEGNCDTLTPINEGLSCDDGAACNVGETCQAGACTGGAAQDCSASGDQCNTASCDTLGAEGNCDTLTPTNEGLSCDDVNSCNVGETCQTGVCTGGAAQDCSGAGDQCNTASCDTLGLEGNCDTLTPVLNGTICDDGAACNIGETCQTGVCSGGGAPDCSAAGDQCNTASCDTLGAEGNCDTFTPANEGLSCDDINSCNVGETCQTGVCTGGAAPDCSAAGDQCNTASCDTLGAEGNCDTFTPANEGLSCDDVNSCNVGETCQTGVCTGGAAQDCSAAGDQCNTASCDTLGAEGNCDTFTPTNEGLSCNDGLACNVGETCQVGVCTGGAAPDCSAAGDQCNTASCDVSGAEGNCDTFTPTNEGLSCDDGAACNVGETCQTGVCTGGAAPDCSASGDPCNTASCDTLGLEGNCDTITQVLDGTACDDLVACTDATCQIGVCTFSNHTGQVTVDLEVEAISTAVTRTVTFVMTSCSSGADTRVIPVAIDSFGLAAAANAIVMNNVDVTASWISVREGHTLRRLVPLSFTGCTAAVDITGVSNLPAGDFQTVVVISQDNIIDITDFSVLATEFNVVIDPTLSTGADVTADGLQGTADFTALQVNFLTVGDAIDNCPLPVVDSNFSGSIRITDIHRMDEAMSHLRTSISVAELPDIQAQHADLNGDGFVDALDIREFATRHNLNLLPKFNQRLLQMESNRLISNRGGSRKSRH